jgi:hypothetical protein
MKRFTGMLKALFLFTLLLSAVVARAETFVVGGALQVARDGSVTATLTGNASSDSFVVDMIFSTGPGQDQFGVQTLFNSNSPIGSTTATGTLAADTPIQLRLFNTTPGQPRYVATTGDIGKDFGPHSQDAAVAFGPNDTALVGFPTRSGAAFSVFVRLSNVTSLGNNGCRI